MKEILYYTDNCLEESIDKKVKEQLNRSGLPVISVSLKPISFGRNIVLGGERGYLSMFRQILKGLENSIADDIFFCEHDVLYHPSHFDFSPKEKMYYYNGNFWKYKLSTGQVVSYKARLLSQLCAKRDILLQHYMKRVKMLEEGSKIKSEPGTRRGIDDYPTKFWYSEYANIDLRHGGNLTGISRFSPEEFRSKNSCREWKETTIDKIEGWTSVF